MNFKSQHKDILLYNLKIGFKFSAHNGLIATRQLILWLLDSVTFGINVQSDKKAKDLFMKIFTLEKCKEIGMIPLKCLKQMPDPLIMLFCRYYELIEDIYSIKYPLLKKYNLFFFFNIFFENSLK